MGREQDIPHLVKQANQQAFKSLIFDEQGELLYELPYDDHSDPDVLTWGKLEAVLGNAATRNEFRDYGVEEM